MHVGDRDTDGQTDKTRSAAYWGGCITRRETSSTRKMSGVFHGGVNSKDFNDPSLRRRGDRMLNVKGGETDR